MTGWIILTAVVAFTLGVLFILRRSGKAIRAIIDILKVEGQISEYEATVIGDLYAKAIVTPSKVEGIVAAVMADVKERT